MVTASSAIFWVINSVICKKGKGQNRVEFRSSARVFPWINLSGPVSTSAPAKCTTDLRKVAWDLIKSHQTLWALCCRAGVRDWIHLQELYSPKISKTEANGKSIISGFWVCLSSYSSACPSVAYCKSQLTRACQGVSNLRKWLATISIKWISCY